MVDKYVQKGFLLDHTHSTVVGQIQLSNLVSWTIQNNTMSEFYHAVWHGTIIKHETQLIITSAVMLKRGCRGFKWWDEYPRGSVQHIWVSCWTSWHIMLHILWAFVSILCALGNLGHLCDSSGSIKSKMESVPTIFSCYHHWNCGLFAGCPISLHFTARLRLFLGPLFWALYIHC